MVEVADEEVSGRNTGISRRCHDWLGLDYMSELKTKSTLRRSVFTIEGTNHRQVLLPPIELQPPSRRRRMDSRLLNRRGRQHDYE